MKGPVSLAIRQRVELWDAVLERVRAVMRGRGMKEVLTAVRVKAPAIEPYIEPIAAPPRWLVTSPELAMKVLLAHGSGSIFQVGPVFRAEEEGPWHREEFHLLEWYRLGEGAEEVRKDVEAVVEAVSLAVKEVLGPAVGPAPPKHWQTVGMMDAVTQTTGIRLTGEESAVGLEKAIASLGWRLQTGAESSPLDSDTDPEVADLAAWTAFFSLWATERLPSWLEARHEAGVHVVDFPPALAALARCEVGPRGIVRACRFESHVGGVELANGYEELTDGPEQRRRFERVNRLRLALGRPRLPPNEEFLDALHRPGLPPCSGAALGVERLMARACGVAALDDILLETPRCD